MDKISSINFKAKPVNTINVYKRKEKENVFEPLKTTFVKIEPDNLRDMRAINYAAKKWEDAKYMQRIATNSHWNNSVPMEFYALTTQTGNFNHLNYEQILGFAEMRPDANLKDFTSLYYLQVKPEAINIFNSPNNTYKRVGSSMITSLKKLYKNIALFSEDSPYLFKFYKTNKFIKDYDHRTRFLWSSNPLTKLKILYRNWCRQKCIF